MERHALDCGFSCRQFLSPQKKEKGKTDVRNALNKNHNNKKKKKKNVCLQQLVRVTFLITQTDYKCGEEIVDTKD